MAAQMAVMHEYLYQHRNDPTAPAPALQPSPSKVPLTNCCAGEEAELTEDGAGEQGAGGGAGGAAGGGAAAAAAARESSAPGQGGHRGGGS